MGHVGFNNETIEFNDEVSQKVFTEPFVDIPDGAIVYASSFYQQDSPESHVFRDDMTGVTFINCNLDNCFIPSGNTLNGCNNRRIKAQEDGRDWIVDENNNPVTPL